jgi:hypothetical protein
MEETIMKLRILARAELTLLRINTRRMALRAGFVAVALGLVLLTVVMLNIGAYELLAEGSSRSTAAFTIAAANGVLALVLTLVARSIRAGPEEEMVREIREMAMTELAADADAVQHEFAKLGEDVKRIRAGLSSFTGGGGTNLGTAALANLGPVIGFLIDALKRRKQ